MEVGKYKYNLANSSVIEINKKGAAINIDLNLNNSTNLNNINLGSVIFGNIKDSNDDPIKNAIVKLMNENLEPLYHVSTDNNGEYIIDNVPFSKRYTMMAMAENKLLDMSKSFSLNPHENKIINFTLLEDSNTIKGVISGQVTYNNSPISGAVISIYNTLNNIDNLIGITYADSRGIFFLSNLYAANYKVKISALSYIPYEKIVTVSPGKTVNINVSLNLNTMLPSGIISGIITDDLNNFIANADVTLYNLDTSNNLTPISFTQTNSSGIYLFTNVPIGNYIVKSNKSQLMDNTNTSQPSTTIHTSGFLASGTYDIALGLLEKGAEINLFNRFAYKIGGTNGGSSTLNFNINEDGMYDVIFQYISPDKNRQVAIDINGKTIGVYTTDITPTLDITDAKTMAISTFLNKGENTIKFYGNSIDYGPNLGIVTFKISSNSNFNNSKNPLEIFNSTENIITTSKDVQLDIKTKFLKNLGGINDNYLEFSFNAPFNGEYNLIFQYLCDVSNSNINILVNNKDVKYSVWPTNSLNLADFKIFTIPIVLKQNNNIIKIHGNGLDYAPNLGIIKVNLPNITSVVSEGILLNDAKIDLNTKFTTKLGGELNGSSTVSIKVSTSALYYLYLQYLSADMDRILKVSINGEVLNNTYTLSKTKDWTLSSIQIFTLPLNLNVGINTIKFQGSSMEYGPNLGNFYVKMEKESPTIFTSTIYNVALGTLKNGAILDSDLNMAKWIGGPLDGNSSLEIFIAKPGIYNLSLNYKNGGGALRIRVNNIDTGSIYNLLSNSLGRFNTNITLNKTVNILNFHGDDSEYTPYLGEFTLTFISPFTNTLPEGTYNIADGIFKNGAKLDPINNLVNYIGGKTNGSSTISVNVKEYGSYDFEIQYVSADMNRPLKIDVNGVDSGKNYLFPMTSSWIISKIEFFTIQLILNKGPNEITFYGKASDYGPSLGIVNISPTSFPMQPFALGNYNASEGILENGANLDEGSNFAGWLGGSEDGSSTITVKVNNSKAYNVTIQYISGAPRKLKIDINGINTGTIYKPEPTLGWTIQDAKIFTISLPLKPGNNTIKFHGDGADYAPSIGIVIVDDLRKLIYDASLGLFENGATLDNTNSLATFIGGPTDGSSTIIINIPNDGFYNLKIQYLSPHSNRPLKIDINDKDTGEIYYLPETNGITINDIKTFTVILDLKAGGNKIKFHGNGTDYAPSIGLVTIINTTDAQVYNSYRGTLSSGAKVDDTTKFVTLIGGLKDESCTINVDILGAGMYNLEIQYIADDYDRVLKLDINGINDGKIYNTPKIQSVDNISTITIPIYLNSGKNTIKIHSNGIDYAPSIGKLFITPYTMPIPANNSSTLPVETSTIPTTPTIPSIPNTPTVPTITLPSGTYSFINGKLEGEAKLNSTGEFVSHIGGPKDSSSTLIVNVDKTDKYILNIEYVSNDIEKPFTLTVNNNPLQIIYLSEKTNSSNKVDSLTINIIASLNEGENTIKIHGDGSDYTPDFGLIKISKK